MKFSRYNSISRNGAHALEIALQFLLCYNIIYNTAPLVLLEQIGEIEEMGIHEIRLHFTIEDTEETKRVIRIYADAFWRGQKTLTAAEVFADFTRGHYKRGIK